MSLVFCKKCKKLLVAFNQLLGNNRKRFCVFTNLFFFLGDRF